MKITNLSLLLTSSDILSLIKKFSFDKSFSISSISITDKFILLGKVSVKSLTIPFKCKLLVSEFNNNYLSVKIDSFTAINISIPAKIKEAALKKILSSFSREYLVQEKDIIRINIPELLKHNNISTLHIDEISLIPDHLMITLKNIILKDSLDTLLSLINIQNNQGLTISM